MSGKNQLEFTIAFHSDWHIGSGAGIASYIDRMILRDREGLPYIPAKTLTGIWRDAAELLADGLDEQKGHDWRKWVITIFGDQPGIKPKGISRQVAPIGSRVRVSDAHVANPLRSRLLHFRKNDPRHWPLLKGCMTVVHPGIQIDDQTGTARDQHLRMVEFARCGLRLSCSVEWLDVAESAVPLVRAFLIASAQLIPAVGGKRRRGAGRCAVETAGDGESIVQEAVDLIRKTKEPAAVRSASNRSAGVSFVAAQPPEREETQWVRFPMVIRLRGPVLSYVKTSGNVLESARHLPGTLLLPLVSRLLPDGVRHHLPAGRIAVLNAYPKLLGRRSLPVPFCFRATKQWVGWAKPDELINSLVATPGESVQTKQLRKLFVAARRPESASDGLIVGATSVNLESYTHNTIEDQVQRPTEAVGGVYTYEAISPADDEERPMEFVSEVRVRKDVLSELREGWLDRLNGAQRLGRSMKDYGLVHIDVEAMADITEPKIEPGNRLRLWCTSDLLLRGDGLGPDSGIIALERELRCGCAAPGLRVDQTVARARRHDSWQVSWGLPRASLVGIEAGSVFEISGVADDAHARLLAQALTRGLGERVSEGFGQIQVNDPLLSIDPRKFSAAAAGGAGTDAPGEPRIDSGTQDDPTFQIELALWRRLIERRAVELASSRASRERILGPQLTDRKPSGSQLSSLREVMRTITADETFASEFIKRISAPGSKRAQGWPRGSLEGIQAFLNPGAPAFWDLMGVSKWPTLSGNIETLKSALRAEALRSVFTTVLQAESRERQIKKPPRQKGVKHGT